MQNQMTSHRPRFYSKVQDGFLTRLQKTKSVRRQRHNSILDELFFLGSSAEPQIPQQNEQVQYEQTINDPVVAQSKHSQDTTCIYDRSQPEEYITPKQTNEERSQPLEELYDADPYEKIQFDYEPTDILNTILHSFSFGQQQAQSDFSTAKSLIQRKIKEIRSHDKILFFFGILMLILISYLMAYDPCRLFIYFNAALCLTLIAFRYFRFRARGMHYYLLDFCYWGNFLVWGYALFFMKNSTIFNIAFFFAQGNLSWAIPTYRNSLIFHNIDHLTTLLIHSQPMLAMSVLRWNEGNGESCPSNLQSPINSIGPISAFYLGWVSLYYVIIFILRYDIIKKNKFQTLYWHSEQQKDKFAGKWINSCGPKSKLKSVLYMILHIISTFIAGSLSILQFHIKLYNILYVGGLLLLSIWNGANYYFEYFAKKYEASLETIKILSNKGYSLEEAINKRGGFGVYEEHDAAKQSKKNKNE